MSASLNDRPNRVEVSGDAATVTAGAGVQGAQGEPGIIISATEPTETDVLWADTSAAGSMVVPAGGTTGQVLAKASGDDYDSEWITPSSGGIPATIIDAKGDLIVGTAADTAARLAVGTNQYVLIADSAQSAGIRWGVSTTWAHWGGYITGDRYAPLGCTGNSTTLSWGANQIMWAPFFVVATATFDQMQIYTNQVAGGEMRLAIYDSTGTGSRPGSLILDTGSVATTGAAGNKNVTISQQLTAGLYWLGVNVNATTTITRWASALNRSIVDMAAGIPEVGYFSSQTYGAYPATAPSVTRLGSIAGISMRAA